MIDESKQLPCKLIGCQWHYDTTSRVEGKTKEDITVRVNEVWYCVPGCCLTIVMWPLSDVFKIDKYKWADNPLQLTTLKMLRDTIILNPDKFVSFILWK